MASFSEGLTDVSVAVLFVAGSGCRDAGLLTHLLLLLLICTGAGEHVVAATALMKIAAANYNQL